jgi:DNA-binding LytR/AlgR family response regulator
MRARIEQVGANEPEEVIIRCRNITPEIETIARQFDPTDKQRNVPAYFKGDKQYYLSLSEIVFFETDDERVFAHTANDSFETRMRLYELEAILPGNFVRVSRAAIINIQHVFSIQKGLTRIILITFRQSHKVIYCSRMYSNNLIHKMEERV